MDNARNFKVAACHASPIYFDVAATVSKATSLIGEAAGNGASLVAFPEAFICAFPVWSGLRSPVENHDFFHRLARSSILIDGPELKAVRDAARRHGIVVSIGFNEAIRASAGCVFDSNVIIGESGQILVHHRKLVPTFWEKLAWANGDGFGLRVADTIAGRVGMLICGENTNPLARFSLMAQGEQVHVASYSPRWPTHPVGNAANYDLAEAIRIRSAAHSFEAKCFTIVSSGFLSDAAAELVSRGETAAMDLLQASPRSVSMVIGPSGNLISSVLQNEEGIAYGDVDLAQCIVAKQFHDVCGYYNRFDIFDLRVNRRRLAPAAFDGEAVVGAADDRTTAAVTPG